MMHDWNCLPDWMEIGKHCLFGWVNFARDRDKGYILLSSNITKKILVMTRVKENNFTICDLYSWSILMLYTCFIYDESEQSSSYTRCRVCLVSDVTREEEVLIKNSALFTFSIALQIISCICLYFQLKASCICFILCQYVCCICIYTHHVHVCVRLRPVHSLLCSPTFQQIQITLLKIHKMKLLLFALTDWYGGCVYQVIFSSY